MQIVTCALEDTVEAVQFFQDGFKNGFPGAGARSYGL